MTGILSSMKTALFLLLLLGAASAVGTLIPQGELPGFYVERYGVAGARIIQALALDHLFSARWYICIGLLLTTSILICSSRRIKRRVSKRNVVSVIAHCGVVAVFVGALISLNLGQSEYLQIGIGDTADLAELGMGEQKITAQDFVIDYYPGGEPKQYTTYVVITGGADDGEVEKKISVNHPVKIGRLKLYQQSYGWLVRGEVTEGDRVLTRFETIDGGEVAIPGAANMRLRTFVAAGERDQGMPSSSGEPVLACALLDDHGVAYTGRLQTGESGEGAGYMITCEGFRRFTGLMVKNDPGVPVVFLGFLMMVVGWTGRYVLVDRRNRVRSVRNGG